MRVVLFVLVGVSGVKSEYESGMGAVEERGGVDVIGERYGIQLIQGNANSPSIGLTEEWMNWMC